MTLYDPAPEVSVVVPARNEADYLPATLGSLASMSTDRSIEVIVVDGDSDDRTPEIACEFGAKVVSGDGAGIAEGRNRGARSARGEWLCFVDADTIVDPSYLDELLDFVVDRDLVAASTRCRMDGWRSIPMQWTINHLFPRLRYPVLPGFNLLVERATFEAVDGFPTVPNEDTAFSRTVARHGPVGYHPKPLVEPSSRRFQETGLMGTTYHYLQLDWHRLRSDY